MVGATRPSLRNGLRLISRSPRGPGFLAPVASRSFCSLSLSVGRPGPHDFAVRDLDVRLTQGRVHRIPQPTFVTIAKRPSSKAAGCAERCL
jgi:hypothetical protein